jgi:hypothetical protein
LTESAPRQIDGPQAAKEKTGLGLCRCLLHNNAMQTMTHPPITRWLLPWLMLLTLCMGALNWARTAPPANLSLAADSLIAHARNALTYQGNIGFDNKAASGASVDAKGGDAQACKNDIVNMMNKVNADRDMKLSDEKRRIVRDMHGMQQEAAARCGQDIKCYSDASDSIKAWGDAQLASYIAQNMSGYDSGQIIFADGYYPQGELVAGWQGLLEQGASLPGKLSAFGGYLIDSGISGVASDLWGGITQAGSDLVDWAGSDLPYQAIERKGEQFLLLSASDVGGIVFDTGLGFLTGYVGEKAVAFIGGKWVAMSARDAAKTPNRESTIGRVFTSTDRYVGEIATKLNEIFPGQVVDVNKNLAATVAGGMREVDIVMDDFIIQVKSGRGGGLARQVQGTSNTLVDNSRRVIGYAPDDYSGLAWQGAAEKGIPIARNFDELVKIIKEMKTQ